MDKKSLLESRANDLVARMHQSDLINSAGEEGCSMNEIERVCNDVGQQIPFSYQLFLQLLGKVKSPIFSEVAILFDELDNVYDLVGYLDSEMSQWLPLESIPFCAETIGGQVCFFLSTDDVIDPPVYRSALGTTRIKKVADSLWDLVEDEIDSLLQKKNGS